MLKFKINLSQKSELEVSVFVHPSPVYHPVMHLILFLGLIAIGATDELSTTEPKCDCSHLLNAEESTEYYPALPKTSFNCWGRYDGYYADVEVDCTIFHYCQTWRFPNGLNETVKWDFACPESTIFNQRILSCTPPAYSFDCKEAPNYYWVNYNLTVTPPPGFTSEASSDSSLSENFLTERIKPKLAELPASPPPIEYSASLPSPTSNPDFEKFLSSPSIPPSYPPNN